MQPKSVSVNLKITPEDFKEACLQSNELPKQLLDYLFNPGIDFGLDSLTKLNEIKLYLTGELSFDEFKRQIKKYDSSSVCGLVWSANYVAYRCRTCSISPCMSLCADCFMNGNHEGHDYNLFRSGAGGACDCGDESVMLKNGFCKQHGDCNRKVQEPPNDLVASVNVILSNLLYRLVQYFREQFRKNDEKIEDSKDSPLDLISNIDVYLEFLNDLCGLGTPIRKIVANSMIDESFYENKIKQEKEQYENKLFLHDTFIIYYSNRNKFERPIQLDSYDFKLIKDKYTNMLDELFYWCIKYEFPDNLVKFLLVLLPESEYKVAIMELFVSNYTTTSNVILNAKTANLSTRVIHISVQLFSNESITIKALNEYNLLPVILTAFYNVLNTPECIVISEMQDKLRNSHLVIDPDHRILQENLYWPIVSDLINLLTHKQVAFSLIQDNKLLDLLMHLISYFQSMNLNIREFGAHVQYEQPSYYSSYSAELECCSSTMWSFIQHLKNPNDIYLTQKLIDMCLKYLIKWIDSVGTRGGISLNREQITFHLPLHRFYSAFMYHAVYRQKASLNVFLPNDETLLIDIIRHPLRTQACVHEIHSNMWVRNGLQMKGQAMTYFQNAFNTSFSESDLFLIQAIACKLNSNKLVYEVLDAHRLFAYFNIIKEKRFKDATDSNQQIALLTGALTLIAELVTITPNLSLEDYNFTKREIINSICQSDRTHSQIEECLPEISTYSQNKKFIDDILNEIADSIQPVFEMHSRGLKQKKYMPKSYIWEKEYDPLFVILRSVKLKEFQEAFDRYSDYVKTKNLFPRIDTLWPPFRLPKLNEIHEEFKPRQKILQTKILHGFLFSILYQHLNENPYPEKVIYFVIYILELSLHLVNTTLIKHLCFLLILFIILERYLN
jgi:E3 ubiquitin-protein ligase UBR3